MKHTLTVLFASVLLLGCSKDTISINTKEGIQKLYSLLDQHIDDNTILNSDIRFKSDPLENDINYIYLEYWGENGADPLNAVWIYTADGGKSNTVVRENINYYEKNTITYGELKKKLVLWSSIAHAVNKVIEDDPDMGFAGVGKYEISFNGENVEVTEYFTLQFTNKNDSKKLSGKRIVTNYYDIEFQIRNGVLSYK
tara:strand:+ start:1480 stop:2070 length:591 start_codon:yes stop_codon:yes gene_type:complete